MPAIGFVGNLDVRRDRRGRRPARGVGRHAARRRPGVHPVLAAVHASSSASSRRSRTSCSRASPRPSACSSCSTSPSRSPIGRRRRRSTTCAARSGSSTSASATSPTQPLIDDLSLVAAPGQTVAIVGPTGAGKTTLVNLLMRFYELDAGRIAIDGVDIATAHRGATCARRSAWCCRTPGCSAARSATTSATATRPRPRPTWSPPRRRPTSTASSARCPTATTPCIDEEAANVSAGEKQLITIARAFLADPAILILDEATSSVDTRTEVLVQHAMAALRARRTSFVIAHRLSTIRDANVILVMEGGRIVEQGSARRAARRPRRLPRPLPRPVRRRRRARRAGRRRRRGPGAPGRRELGQALTAGPLAAHAVTARR